MEWGHYAVLGMVSDPSLAPLLLGAVTLLVGTTVTVLVRPRCIHAVVRGKEGVVEIGLVYAGEDAKGAGGRDFETLVAEAKEACRAS